MRWQKSLQRWLENRRGLRTLLEWTILFLGLLAAFWVSTQNEAAPQSILIVFLTLLTINFGLPASRALITLLPIVSISGYLILGFQPALLLTGVGILLAEISRPLWTALWQPLGWSRESRWQRFAYYALYELALLGSGLIYSRVGGDIPITVAASNLLPSLLWMGVTYFAIHFLGVMILWSIFNHSFARFWAEQAVNVLLVGILVQPFGAFAGIVFAAIGLPAFVIYAIGIATFAAVLGLSWQRRFALQRQLRQMSLLNKAGFSLREAIDLPAVLQRIYKQVATVVQTDQFAVILQSSQNPRDWEQSLLVKKDVITNSTVNNFQPDDFTGWVLKKGRTLDLDPQNSSYAGKHHLTPPPNNPAYWLGLPLINAGETVGALVLQRFDPDHPFGRWHQEVLLAIASQASTAIENARLHNETIRLYNLTDEALSRRVEQLQALLNSTQEGVLMLDTKGRIVLVNPTAAALMRAVPGDLQGRQLENLEAGSYLGFSSADINYLLTALQEEIPLQPQWKRFTTTYPDREEPDSYTPRYVDRNGVPVLSNQGQVMGWLMTLRDVTEEQELDDLREDVTRMIVHDLRNPVSTLMSTINQLEEKIVPANGSEQLVETAKRGCLNMLDMVDSLMDVQRMEAGQSVIDAEAMRMPALIEKVLTHLQPLAMERGISLTFEMAPELPAIWADELIVRRILLNLLDNALKFTPAGGRVFGELRVEEMAGKNAGIRCLITDSGPGIPPVDRELIFDRYARMKQSGQQVRGVGLGLTFCKMMVEAQDGKIWAQAGVNGGGCFVFTLPGIPEFSWAER